MPQNFQTIDPNARFIDLHSFTLDPPAARPAAAGPRADEANWEIKEFDVEDAEFEELTKLFVPFEPDFD